MKAMVSDIFCSKCKFKFEIKLERLKMKIAKSEYAQILDLISKLEYKFDLNY